MQIPASLVQEILRTIRRDVITQLGMEESRPVVGFIDRWVIALNEPERTTDN